MSSSSSAAAAIPLDVFEQISREMEDEGTLRDAIRAEVRELERAVRSIAAGLNSIHSSATPERVQAGSAEALQRFDEIRQRLSKLAGMVPDNQYFRYNGMWSFTLQSACFLAAFVFYLQQERLITTAEAERVLGVPVSLDSSTPKFHVSIEEYLHGLITLASELTRLAVNSVTAGDFARPLRIAAFVSDLHAGFQLLNLKNDSLRKRFDSLKYEVKRIEEIVYDISVRGLAGKVEVQPVSATAGEEGAAMVQ